jgi:hypothetical protein
VYADAPDGGNDLIPDGNGGWTDGKTATAWWPDVEAEVEVPAKEEDDWAAAAAVPPAIEMQEPVSDMPPIAVSVDQKSTGRQSPRWMNAALALVAGVAITSMLLGVGVFSATDSSPSSNAAAASTNAGAVTALHVRLDDMAAAHRAELDSMNAAYRAELDAHQRTMETQQAEMRQMEAAYSTQLALQHENITAASIERLEAEITPLRQRVEELEFMTHWITTTTTTTMAGRTSSSVTTTTATTGTSTTTTGTTTTTTTTASTVTSTTTSTSDGRVHAPDNVLVNQALTPAAFCNGTAAGQCANGSRTMSAQEEADLVSVNGDLFVTHTKLNSLAGRFPNLVRVAGHLVILANTELTTLGDAFASLQVVGGDLNLQGHRFAASPNSIAQAFPVLQRVEGSLHIDDIDGITALDGAFPSLTLIEDELMVNMCDDLADIGTGFANLRVINGGMILASNTPGQVTLDGVFPRLVTVNESVMISTLSTQTIAGSFPQLRNITHGGLQLYNLGALTSITDSFPSLIRMDGDLMIFGNPNLASLSGSLGALTTVNASLRMYGFDPTYDRNDALVSLACVGSIDWKTDKLVEFPEAALTLPQC